MRWPPSIEGLDPKKQSSVEGVLAAVEAAVGGLIALVAGLGIVATGSIILDGRDAHHGRLSPLQGLWISVGLVPIALAFLWAGLSLAFGWRTTWRTQVVPVATLLLAVSYVLISWVAQP